MQISPQKTEQHISSEKLDIRERLHHHIRNNPVRKTGFKRFHAAWGSNLLTPHAITLPLLPALAVILLLGGGLTVAAEKTEPGNALYPIKTEVNEPIRGILALSVESEARLHAEFAERRLSETIELSTVGKLTDKPAILLQKKFNEHMQVSLGHIEEIEAKDDTTLALEITNDIHASLSAYAGVMGSLNDTSETTQAGVSLVRESVINQLTTLDTIEAELSVQAKQYLMDSDDGLNRAEERLERAEDKIAEVQIFLVRKSSKLTDENQGRLNAQLTQANDLVTEGKEELEAKAYDRAFNLFGEAHQVAVEAMQAFVLTQDIENVDIRFDNSGHVEVLDNKHTGTEDVRDSLNSSTDISISGSTNQEIENADKTPRASADSETKISQ